MFRLSSLIEILIRKVETESGNELFCASSEQGRKTAENCDESTYTNARCVTINENECGKRQQQQQ